MIASDFGFESPDSVDAGWTWVRLVNRGPSVHHVQIYRIPEGRSVEEAMDALPTSEPMPEWLEPFGGPEGGDEISRDVDTAVFLEPGHYLLVCRFATDDDTLHLTEGMVRGLVVSANENESSPAWAALPDTIWMQDYSFALTDSVRSGLRDFVVVNRGPQEHHVAIARLRPGMGLRDVIAEYSANSDAPQSFDVVGGTAGQGIGRHNISRVRLEPGSHVLLCFETDPVSGLTHVVLSMLHVFEVVSNDSAT